MEEKKNKKRIRRRICLVTGCPGIDSANIRLFRIPERDKEVWCANLKIKPTNLSQRTGVCSRHFEKHWLGATNLRIGARPTLHLGYEDTSKIIKPTFKPGKILQYCCIQDCGSTSRATMLHEFPKNEALLQKWLKVCVIKENFVKKSYKYICSKHFEAADFENEFLKSDAIPKWEHENEQMTSLRVSEEEFMDISSIGAENSRATDGIFAESIDVAHGQIIEQPLRSISTQTALHETKTCAFITATENLLSYNVNCCFCDAVFSVSDWKNFQLHFECKHRNLTESFTQSNVVLANFADRDEFIFVKDDFTNSNSKKKFSSIEIANECDAWDDILAETEQLNPNPLGEGSNSDDVNATISESTDEEISDTEFNKFPDDSQMNGCKTFSIKRLKQLQKKYTLKEQDAEIDIETTAEKIILSLIDLLRSYFRLWYAPKIKQAHNEKTFNEFHFKFIERNQINLKRTSLFASVQKLRDWYQEMFKNNQYESLKYPQSEYYSRLAEFLPDRLDDGKTCEICKCVFPDNLQHYAHKQQKHANSLQAGNFYLSGVPKTKIYDYLRARYPITGPLNFECQICFATINARRKLIDHIKTHINVREYVCDICGKAFIRQTRFTTHRKRHFGENKIICKICGQQFNDPTPLTAHRVKYHRPIEGTIEEIVAAASCKQPATAWKQRKKTGRKRSGFYKCVIDAETKRKFYACAFCDKKYAYQPGLNKHLLCHHKELYKPEKRKKKNS